MAYLMTHSLLSAWQYSMKESPFDDLTTEDTSEEDFLRVLRREPTPTSEAMQNGIDFENMVTAILNVKPVDRKADFYEAASKVAEMIPGAKLQVVAKKYITIDGMCFLLYGRLDALKEGRIFDIKFSKRYERGKFFGSTQHPMYMALVPEAMNFTYIVSDGKDVWTETYWWDESPRIEPVIRDFIEWLKATGNLETYQKYWGEQQ